MITRRDLLRGIAGTAGLLGWPPGHASGEPPPETTRLRVHHSVSLCQAPQYVAEDLLRGEGFTDVQYVPHGPKGFYQTLGSGEADIAGDFAPQLIIQLVNSAVDRPWSQYFCCMSVANRDFARKYPVATKRALRAILKAADICALEPDRAAKSLVAQGVAKRYEYALQTMKDVPYTKWRDYDPEDTMRFCALRLDEIGMIKASPQKIIAQGTDWRFLNELKKELKG